MSITAWLKHISANGLQRTKENLDIYKQVIFHISPINCDAPILLNSSELTVRQIDALKEIKVEIKSVCNKWSIYDVELVEDLKCNHPKIYERIKPDLYSIIADEKNCLSLDLDFAWGHISSIFRCAALMDSSTFIKKTNGSTKVNLFSGKLVDPKDSDPFFTQRYQEVKEVREIAQSLSEVDQLELRKRFEHALKTQPPAYEFIWNEEFYPFLMERCEEVKSFYQNAATQNFGIVNAIF
jgi:hypothetical protein